MMKYFSAVLLGLFFSQASLGVAAPSFASIAQAQELGEEAAQTESGALDFETLVRTAGQNDERMMYHIDSWVSLALIASSFLIAFALNHAQPSIRVMGSFLAAMGCLALFAWLLFTFASGIVQNPRPSVFPPDALKPAMLALQAAAALAAALFLLLATHWQRQRSDTLALNSQNSPTHYGFVHRMLHWTTAILFLLLIPMGIFTSLIPDDVWFRQGYYVAHKTIGATVLILVLLRLFWRHRSPPPPLDPSLKNWERRLAHSVHFLLYLFLIAFPLSGFIMSTSGGKLSHFFIWDAPLFWEPNETGLMVAGLIHKVILPYIFYILIGAHVLGALKHQFLDRHPNAFRRIVS